MGCHYQASWHLWLAQMKNLFLVSTFMRAFYSIRCKILFCPLQTPVLTVSGCQGHHWMYTYLPQKCTSLYMIWHFLTHFFGTKLISDFMSSYYFCLVSVVGNSNSSVKNSYSPILINTTILHNEYHKLPKNANFKVGL